MFYDSGNADSDYSSNENYTITFKPRSSNEKLIAEFLAFSVEKDGSGCWDYLEIYDGESTSAEMIGSYCDASPPTTIIPTNNTGSLTFRFYSDGIITQSGWEAEISHQAAYNVKFIVKDGENSLIEGVKVAFNGNELNTDSNGEATFHYVSPEDNINYSISKSGFNSYSGTVSVIDEDITVNVKLISSGIENISEISTKIYPNPSNGILNLEISGSEYQEYKVKIYDVLGSMVYNTVCTYGTEIKEQIDISNHPKGMYFISIESENGILFNRKIIVK
jgi:hypothetical protein